jgi:hypothetical protein
MSREDLLEEFENVKYRMEAEGFHYCFDGYSSFDEVKDEKFHQLRLSYLSAAEELQQYVKLRINELS